MTIQTLANFNGTELPLIEHANDAWFTSADIGAGLDYSEPRKAINKIYERNQSELFDCSVVVKMTTTDGKKYDTRIFNEEGVISISFLSKQPKAVAFRRWARKILKDYRHNNLGSLIPVGKILVNEKEYIGLLKEKIALLEKGKRPHRRLFGTQETAQIMRLHAEGVSNADIAKRLVDRTGSTIGAYIKKQKRLSHANSH